MDPDINQVLPHEPPWHPPAKDGREIGPGSEDDTEPLRKNPI